MASLQEQAEECIGREFCPDCKGYGFEGEGCIPENCKIFQEEVDKTLKDWATEDVAREPA